MTDAGSEAPLRCFLGAFGDPGHAFPMLALGAELAARGHAVTFETWERWRGDVEAAAALPDELIDTLSLCGPPDVIADRLAAYREAGVGTLIVSPTAPDVEGRLAQLRAIAALNG